MATNGTQIHCFIKQPGILGYFLGAKDRKMTRNT